MQVNMKLVGEVMSRLNREMSTTPSFKFNLEPQTALDLLTVKYVDEVRRRDMVPELDIDTQTNLISLAKALTNPGNKFGIWLYGEPGNGKTTMMRAFMQSVMCLASSSHFDFMGKYFQPKVKFINAKRIVPMFIDQPRDFNDLKEQFILCIDDIGTEPKEVLNYGNVETPMMDLLMSRYACRRFTFVTSNLAPNAIREKYDERIADRCREMFHCIKFLAPSYRKQK